MIPSSTVDLARPPEQRWLLSAVQRQQARDMLNSYLNDLGGIESFRQMLGAYAAAFIASDHLAEIESIAKQIDCTPEEAVLVNLYYDALKMVFGCTAFAVDTPDGPLHARNLDWWTENDMLSRFTTRTNFGDFITVGWPGFVGALSGVALGRFAITLNAVLSNDPVQIATPISMFIRTVFEKAASFDEAVTLLANETIASDCLLLVTGTQPGEMVVIERTPTRHAIRTPQSGFIAVTNSYLLLDTSETTSGDLGATSDTRYERTCQNIRGKHPQNPAQCFAYLDAVRMPITVQQMVFSAQRGEVAIRA